MTKACLISIVTAVKDDSEGLEVTMSSLERLSQFEVEWVIQDGTRGDTLESVSKGFKTDIKIAYERRIDNGVYEAMNRGVERALGSWVIFINAGDKIYDQESFAEIRSELEGNEHLYDIVYFGYFDERRGGGITRQEWPRNAWG